MNKQLSIAIMLAVGLVICLAAPAAWRLVGAICMGGGCYAIIEVLRLSAIQREVERYERLSSVEPLGQRALAPLSVLSINSRPAMASGREQLPRHVGWASLVLGQASQARVHNLHLTHRPNAVSARAVGLARMLLHAISTSA